MRNFDAKQQTESIKNSAVNAVRSIFPVQGRLRTLRLDNVWVDDKAGADDFAEQAKTKLREGTWGASVYAAISLVENATGKVLDQAPKLRLFLLPTATARSSYIVGGNEYQVNNQLRLKSGVYTIRKQNGELKTQVNLSKGRNFDLAFNEASGVFTIQKIGGGQTNIPLYPLLAHLGVSPGLVAQTWGSKLEAANRRTDPRAVQRAETAFGVKKDGLKEYFDKTSISPDTTKLVLGSSYEKVDGPMLLAASKNLLDVHLGKKEPVDRDSLAFKEVHGVEDFIAERIEKNKTELIRHIKRQVDAAGRTKVTQIVNPGKFGATVEGFFTQDDKAATPEQTNPLEMVSGGHKATFMGSGGITSRHAIKDEMRQVHPSHYGFIDPIHTPESERIGVNLHLPIGVVKDGKELRAMLKNAKTGMPEALTPTESWQKYVAFPGQSGDTVKALYQGKIVMVPKSKVEYYTPTAEALFSPSTNLVPFLPSNQGNRAMMASKMLEQAIGLKHREAPLVQVAQTHKPDSMEEELGKQTAILAPTFGTVKKVTDDFILLATTEGDKKINLYNNFSLNRKSFLHHTPVVKEGDKVKAGQLLAESNFTRGGTLALGTNLRAAYIPYKGYNFEDGIVISQSAAEKLTSEHIYKKSYVVNPQTVLKLIAFKSNYPGELTAENTAKLDEEGIIKKGKRVKPGEIIIAALEKRNRDAHIAIVSKTLADRPKNAAIYWTYEDEGVVTEVSKTGSTITVYVRTEERAKIGDKLSGRMGNKGIITKILGDGAMPKDAGGNPVDILLNPHGVIGRINIGQIYESAAGKAALKAGAPVKVQNFSGQNYLSTTRKLLKEHGTSDKEELFDPETGKSLGPVHVGNPYILKLFKQSQGNFSVRQGGPGNPYDSNLQPLKTGGEEGSKSLDLLTMYSLLSHGARANLREMSSLKANVNEEYWKALRSGQQLPPPKAPFVFDKFMAYLKGAGIDVQKDGTKLTLAPLTDSQVERISSGAVKKPQFYHAKDFQPVKDGFFDGKIFGGLSGTRWGHMDLVEPVVNPAFEDAARKLLGLSGKFDEIVGGKLFVKPDGSLSSEPTGVTGGAGIELLLKKIDVDSELKTLTRKAEAASGTKLDEMNKRLRYLSALKQANVRPEEAYIRKKVPVLPPIYRPIYPLPTGQVATSPVNDLYQNAGVVNSMMQLPVMGLLPEEAKSDIRADLYNHVKGVVGLANTTIKGKPKDGLIAEIKGGTGGQPKEGFFISKLLSKQQDFVGRGTIIPEPSLGVDEMAMPEPMAWGLFEPFVIRELRNFGLTPNDAKQAIKKRTVQARRALENVMKQRHVLLNRAPSLHKFSIMAFKPKITDGKAIKIPPLIVQGFNADFDGDTMTVHVPIGDEANKEAERLKPSRNLFQPGSGKLMIQPSQEAQIGLFYLSQTVEGRRRLNAYLPQKYHVQSTLDKKATSELVMKLSKELPSEQYGTIVANLKAEGEKHAFERGFTLGVEDIAQFGATRDRIVDAAAKAATRAKDEKTLMDVNKRASTLIDKVIEKKLTGKQNPLFDMVRSGARGNASQLRQIVATPLFMSDEKGRIIPTPIKKSYAEGLDVGDYWISMYGARRGMMDRAIQTSLPGAFSKDIMATTIGNVISKEDCGTREGVSHRIEDTDVYDRFLAGDQGGYAHNTLVDTKVVADLKKKGLTTIKVRSPLRCIAPKGTCAKCYGLDEHGHTPELGDNIGAKAGQTMSEPLVQMVMRCSVGHVIGEDGKAYAFEDYYDSVDEEESFDGHCWAKPLASRVLDAGGRFVGTTAIQTHAAEDRMLFFKTKTGHTLLVQANHPVWVYNEMGDAEEKCAGDIKKGDRLRVETSMLAGSEKCPLDPYFVGRYLADGSTRYGNGTAKYKGKAVATIITGADIEVQQKTMLSAPEGSRCYPKDIQVYKPCFAEEMARVVRGREAKTKRLCPGFNLWAKEDLARLLAGYIDGDSSVYLQHDAVTVAQIYTTSYLILQQMEMICYKLGLRFTPQLVPKMKSHKSQQFVAQIRFPDETVREHSIKLKRVRFEPFKYAVPREEFEPVTYIKKVWVWDQPVWDIKTATRGFVCGMVRNHNTFHTGGAAGTGADVQGYARIDQLLQMPKQVAGAAPLSPIAGRVTKITKGLGGGFDVTIGKDKIVHVPQGKALKVKVGDEVARGTPISEGPIKPQDLVKMIGMDAAQDYLAEELKKSYQGQGVNLHRKVFETVVRSMGNTTQVQNAPKGTGYLPGDVIPYTMAQHHNKNLVSEVPIEQAVGFKLAEGAGGLKKGHLVTAEDAARDGLRGLQVKIEKDPIVHAPLLKSVRNLPLLRKDWMAALGYQQLQRALTTGASQGWSTNLSDYHPIPAFAYGAEFGKGKEGKY
jgi:DNA-directed RNA polymerase beta subunit/DNA-directed RNA polymerase beta' subunit